MVVGKLGNKTNLRTLTFTFGNIIFLYSFLFLFKLAVVIGFLFIIVLTNSFFQSDGNTKDTIRISRNMTYNYDTQQPIPDLQDFLDDLVVEVLITVFFQQSSEKEIDMLRLPLIMAKCVRGNMVNYDVRKKTIMEKSFKYNEETLIRFQEMLDNKEVSIKSISDLAAKDLKLIGDKLGINSSAKSGEVLKTDLVNLSKV